MKQITLYILISDLISSDLKHSRSDQHISGRSFSANRVFCARGQARHLHGPRALRLGAMLSGLDDLASDAPRTTNRTTRRCGNPTRRSNCSGVQVDAVQVRTLPGRNLPI